MMIAYYYTKILKKLRGTAIKNSSIHPSSKCGSGSVVIGSTIDRYSYCGYDCQFSNCTIGAFTSIASHVSIGNAIHPMDWVSTSAAFYADRAIMKKKFERFERPKGLHTVIGNDVWIGEYVLIKGGVTVGDGSVIGMGSVVTKDVPSYAIVAGSPARLIRYRFDEETIAQLASLKWWDWEDEKLKKFSMYMQNPREFIRKAQP